MKLVQLLHTTLRALTAALMLLGVSCGPQIYTNIRASLPARPEGAPVKVFEMTDTVPATAELLGDIRITSTGFSTYGGYDRVVTIAKDATNKIGGNAVVINGHTGAMITGGSHQIAADMLLIRDSLYPGPQVTAAAPRLPDNDPKRINPTTSSRKKVFSTVMVSAGYSLMVSRFPMPKGATGHPKRGLDVTVVYQITSRSGFGAGFRYSGYFSSATLTRYYDKDGHVDVQMDYFAPEVAMRQTIGNRWGLHESIGIGAATNHSGFDNRREHIRGIGVHGEVGVEYKITRYLGLGASVTFYAIHLLGNPTDTSYLPQKSTPNMARFTFDGGLRFYF